MTTIARTRVANSGDVVAAGFDPFRPLSSLGVSPILPPGSDGQPTSKGASPETPARGELPTKPGQPAV